MNGEDAAATSGAWGKTAERSGGEVSTGNAGRSATTAGGAPVPWACARLPSVQMPTWAHRFWPPATRWSAWAANALLAGLELEGPFVGRDRLGKPLEPLVGHGHSGERGNESGQGGEGFTAANPNIKVDVTVADWDAYWDKLQTGLAGGAALGIALGWGGKTFDANSAVGILGDFIVWYPEASTFSTTRGG